MKWFKFECAEPESPVGRAILRRLGRAGFGSYVLLQCFVGQHGAEVGRGINAEGEPFDYDTLVDAARCTEEEFDELVGVLLEKGAIDETAWHERHELCFPDLVRRAERYAREKGAAQTLRSLSADSAPRSDQNRSEEEQKEREGDEDVAAPLLFPVPLTETAKMQSLVELWNSMAGSAGLPQAAGLSDGRKRHIRRRLKERSLEGWKEVFLRIAASRFCCGENDRGWRASFDWIISSPEPALKVMEGKYDNRPRRLPMPARPSGAMYVPSAEETTEYLERMERAAKGGRS